MGSVRLSRKRVTLRRLAKRRTQLLTGQSDSEAPDPIGFAPAQTLRDAFHKVSPAECGHPGEDALVGAH